MQNGEETGGNYVSREETGILSIIEPYPRPLIAVSRHQLQQKSKINFRLSPPGLVARCFGTCHGSVSLCGLLLAEAGVQWCMRLHLAGLQRSPDPLRSLLLWLGACASAAPISFSLHRCAGDAVLLTAGVGRWGHEPSAHRPTESARQALPLRYHCHLLLTGVPPLHLCAVLGTTKLGWAELATTLTPADAQGRDHT